MKDPERPKIGSLAAGVARALENRIRAGVLPGHRALPSEREIATEFKVSRGVVRAAIAHLAKIGLVDHRPNHRPIVHELSKAVKGSRLNIGAWLWPNSSDFSAASILKGIQSANLGGNAQVIVACGAGDSWDSILDSERDFLESMAADPSTLGVIVWYLGGDRNLPSLQRLRDRNVPVVCVDRLPPESFDVDYVGTNNFDAASNAVHHLVELGHRRIAMISNIDPASSVAERESGYHRAVAEAGIRLEDSWIQRVTYDAVESVAGATERLLSLSAPPTAIFCINDLLGLQVYDIVSRATSPKSSGISVVGFDGSLRWVPGGGYLTTMRQDFERMGRIAATLVQQRADGGEPTAYRHYLLDAPITLGVSSGSPSERAENLQPTYLSRRL